MNGERGPVRFLAWYNRRLDRLGHPQFWVFVCAAAMLWMVILTALLLSRGYWWGVAVLAPAAVQLYALMHFLKRVETQAARGKP